MRWVGAESEQYQGNKQGQGAQRVGCMEERGLGKPWANSNVREEWELKGTDVTQLKIRVQGFFPTLGKKVSEQPGIEEEQILCGSRGERGQSPRQLWSQLCKTWDVRHTAGSG